MSEHPLQMNEQHDGCPICDVMTEEEEREERLKEEPLSFDIP